MALFKASQMLVDLLIQFGFTDNTEKLYPEHFQRMKMNGYDPYSMKRIFCFPPHEDYILFHYVYITIHHGGHFNHTYERRLINNSELRSLIAFYKLPQQFAKEWIEAYANALGLHKYYRNVCALPEVYNSELDKHIKDTYENVVIH